jgi:predicted ferric reductase
MSITRNASYQAASQEAVDPRWRASPWRLVSHRLRVRAARFVWALAIPTVILAPLLLSSDAGHRGDLMLELALGTGLLASSMLVVVVVAASRMRSITNAFGIERVLISHRWFGLLALILVLIHTSLVLLDNPRNVYLLTFYSAPPRARAATGATIAIILLCAAAVFRRRLNWPYEVWRRIHLLLATAVLVLTGLHVYWLNHLIRNAQMRACFVAMASVVLLVLGKRWVIRPLFSQHRRFLIEAVRRESPMVSTLVLKPRYRWQRGMKFAPGQFAWIRLNDSARPWEDHPFTIASGAHRPRQLEFTIRHVGDFTRTIAALAPGRTVQVDGPYGSFSVDHRPSRSVLLIAGGVGLTPMMSILRTLDHRRDRRPVCLVVGARHLSDLLFRAELSALSERMQLRVLEVLSDPPDDWPGLRGRVDAEILAVALPTRRERTDVDVYICGSPPMVGGVLTGLQRLAVPPQRIHTEQFDMI